MKSKYLLLSGIALCILFTVINSAFAQGNAFTYQGRLADNGAPYTGTAEFQATLWDAVSGGSQIAANSPAQIVVGVTNGLFVLPLDFGANFPGSERWLQLEVRTNAGSFTTLTPRQPLTPAPYAITAGNLTGTLPAAQLSGTVPSANLAGTYSDALTLNNAANSFSGSGAGLTSLNASQLASGTVPDARLGANVARTDQVWLLGGNAGTTPGTRFLGTTDNQPLEIKVNGMRALRLEPNAAGGPNIIGGSPNNFVGSGVVGATIGGGGALNYLGLALTNRVEGHFGTVSGGARNTIQTDAFSATIGGGYGNTIQTNAFFATIGGGYENTIQTNANYSTIGGGEFNTIRTSARYSTIGGGYLNMIQTDARYSTIGGGYLNMIQTDARYSTIGGGYWNAIQTDTQYSTIGGGWRNTIQSNAFFATIGGGYENTIQSNAVFATIPGGYMNSATNYAFAAGHRAKAYHTGAFVWADSLDADFPSTANDQFNVRASGGARFETSGGGLSVDGVPVLASNGSGAGLTSLNASQLSSGTVPSERISGAYPGITSLGTTGNVGIGTNNPNAKLEVTVSNGQSLQFRLDGGVVPGINVANSGGNAGIMRLRNAMEIHPSDDGTRAGRLDVRNTSGSANITLNGSNGNISCVSLTQTSDRNAKENFESISAKEILEKVIGLPISKWSFKNDSSGKHIGPMAQDFYAAFGTGSNDKQIATVDADGVALAAIQGLNQKVEAGKQQSEERIQKLEAENTELKHSVNELKDLVGKLTRKLEGGVK